MAAITTAIIAASALGYGIYSGEKQKKAQKEALRQQERAQRDATAQAASQMRQAQMQERKANQKLADMVSLLGARGGPLQASTLLSRQPKASAASNNTTTMLGE